MCGKLVLYWNITCHWFLPLTYTAYFADRNTYIYLAQLIGKRSVCHPAVNASVLNVIGYISKQGSDVIVEFWTSSVQSELLSSSPEKKYLAFQLALHFLPFISPEKVRLHVVQYLKRHNMSATTVYNAQMYDIAKLLIEMWFIAKQFYDHIVMKKYRIYSSISCIFLYQNIAQKVRCDLYTDIWSALHEIQNFSEMFSCYCFLRYRLSYDRVTYRLSTWVTLHCVTCHPHGMFQR